MKLIDINELNESVTFWVENDVPIDDQYSSYENVGSISSYLSFKFFRYVEKNKPFFYKYLSDKAKNSSYPNRIEFDADGDDYFEKTGIVNVYTNGIVSDHFYKDFMEALKHATDAASKYVTFGSFKSESSKNDEGKRQSVDGGSKAFVIRVPVVKNDNDNFDDADAPELNISNTNARALLSILGLDDEELGGSVDYKDIPRLMMKIRNIQNAKVDSAVRQASDTADDPEAQGARIIDFGLSNAQIRAYLDRLLPVLDYAMKRKSDLLYG